MLNKFPFHRILVLFILLGVSLAACNATPALTSTAVLKQTPISTQTSKISPTPTENPLAGAPEGATGKDEAGYYMDNDGERYRQALDSKGNILADGWFRSAILESPDNIKGGISLLDGTGGSDEAGAPLYLLVQNGVTGIPSFGHEPIVGGPEWGKSLSAAIAWGLFHSRFENMSKQDFYTALKNGDISVPFVGPDGKEYIWNPSTGYKFYAVSLEDTNNPEFFETPEHKQFGDAVYRWAVSVDADGFLVVKGWVKDPSSLTIAEMMEWILNPMGMVIEHKTLPTKEQMSKGWLFSTYPSPYVTSATTRTSHPFFEIKK